ncbi:MAG: copper homeostasis protein CutC [Terracidiphilus sp.]
MRGRAGFELCAETVEAARIADTCGADRVELCVNLAVGGTTPALKMTKAAIAAISIPLHVLVRPRAGNFVYTQTEFAQMKNEIREAGAVGASGVVLGVLREDGRVDEARSRELVDEARPMKVTFHRAFDEAPEPGEALEAVLAAGADWLLTSGGERNVAEGAETLAWLVRQANGRIQVMGGGGLRLDNMVEVIRATGVEWVHSSLLRGVEQGEMSEGNCRGAMGMLDALRADVREAMRLLRDGEL